MICQIDSLYFFKPARATTTASATQQLANIAQAQANAQSAQAAAAADLQKQQGIAETKVKIAQAQTQFDIQKLEREAAIKKELMEFEFELNMSLKEKEADVIKNKEKYTGCTVHYVNDKLDSGKIILQKKIKIFKNDNPKSIKRRVLNEEHQTYYKAILKIFNVI